MSRSYTVSESKTFTVVHARNMAAKVAADLKRIQRFYGEPSDAHISSYETEVVELLKAGYLGEVTYGYRRDNQWVEPTVRYTAKDLAADDGNGDDPGKIRPGANINGAAFHSFLTYSAAWLALTSAQKEVFKNNLPFQRGNGVEPGISGYLVPDRTYSAGGKALDRSSLRSY